jgi:restriction system protein
MRGQETLNEELQAESDRLDEDLRAELPLKRIWTVAMPEEAE